MDMNKLNKAFVGTAAAAAMAVSASPAIAKHSRNDGPSAGEVIAGVAVIGAIAAIASSGNRDRGYYDNRYRDTRYRGHRYDNRRYSRINARQAVNRCTRAAENRATRRGRAFVTNIRDVDRTRYGYRVKGKIVVEQGRGRYRRAGYVDRGKFTCYIDGNRVSNVQYRGLDYARHGRR